MTWFLVQAGQDFSASGRVVKNRGELLGGSVVVTAEGTYEPQVSCRPKQTLYARQCLMFHLPGCCFSFLNSVGVGVWLKQRDVRNSQCVQWCTQ